MRVDLTQMISVADLLHHAKDTLEKLQNGVPIIITKNGSALGVLMNVETFQELSSPNPTCNKGSECFADRITKPLNAGKFVQPIESVLPNAQSNEASPDEPTDEPVEAPLLLKRRNH